MRVELSSTAVARRLARLRALLEEDAEESGRAPEHGVASGTFTKGVAQRLTELRALCDLTDYLHRNGRAAMRDD